MTREEMLMAVRENDAKYDGAFTDAVKSTGVYCRPSCASRQPKPENILLFSSPAEAEAAGFRPCKRCRPDLAVYRPAQELAREMKAVVESGFLEKAAMFDKLKGIGVTPKRAIEIFKAEYGVTPGAYADGLRAAEARRRLLETDEPIVDIAYSLGFESLSAFYAMFGKTAELSPAAFRKAVMEQGAGTARLYQTEFGAVTVAADDRAVTAVRFGDAPVLWPRGGNALTDLAAGQLAEYFGGRRQRFTVPIRPAGTDFQRQVWEALLLIPYGQTRSYSQVASSIGRPGAARAVGMANHQNPIAVLIPCHRVVGANGALTGYAAGLPVKRRLLELEQTHTD